jgi:hypothetical protein
LIFEGPFSSQILATPQTARKTSQNEREMESAFRNRPHEDEDDDSSTSSGSILTSNEEDADAMGIAAAAAADGSVEQASRAVVRSRKLVWCVFVLATLACSIATYFFVKRSEYNTFQLQVSSCCCVSLATYRFSCNLLT